MSYQIKSTPYFRRMFNNSKKNGQLQRLREEYERIQEFNDRTIELKMRQVRLKRLFREIEELKEGGGGGGNAGANAANRASGGGGGAGSPSPTSVSRSTRRRHHQPQGHHHHQHHHHQNLLSAGITPEQRRHHQRAEALIRSRELGKELSRRNAQMAEAGVGGYLRPDLRTSAKMRAVADFRRDAQERRERAAKRISYGNDQSRQNLQRQIKVCQRRLTAKYQPLQRQEISPNEFHPDYRNVTPSQLDMMVDEEEMAEEQQRFFREQEEDELQLAEERFRRQEKRLRLEVAGSSITSEEEEDGQEELRFLRGEQALSEPEDDEDKVNLEKEMELRRRPNYKQHVEERFLGDHKYNLTLAEEHFRLVAGYSDEERQGDQENEDEDPDEAPQQVDETEAEEQWGRRLRGNASLLPLRRFSLSSTAIETAPSAHHQNNYEGHPVLVARAFSSDQDMCTAPLANEEQVTTMVPPRSVKCRTLSETDDVPALNNWRRVSLMMPWFKVFSPRNSLSERSLDRTMQELPLRGIGAELSMADSQTVNIQ